MTTFFLPPLLIEEQFDIERIHQDNREEYLSDKLESVCSNDQFEGKIYALAETMCKGYILDKMWDVIAIKDPITNTDISFFMALPDPLNDTGLYHVTSANGTSHYLNGTEFGIVVSATVFNHFSHETHDLEMMKIMHNYFAQLRGYFLSLAFGSTVKIIELLD